MWGRPPLRETNEGRFDQFQQVNELLLLPSIKMPRDGFHLELVWRIRAKPASR